MYKPSESEQAQIDRALAAVRQAVDELDLGRAELARASKDWLSFEQPPPLDVYAPLAARLEKEFPAQHLPWALSDPALAARLGRESPQEQLPWALAAVLAHPAAVDPASDQADERPGEIGVAERLTIVVAAQWSVEHFSPAAAGSLGTRLRHFFSSRDDWAVYRQRGLPGIESYLELVHRVGDHPDAAWLVEDLVTGEHYLSTKFPWVDRGPILWRVTLDDLDVLDRRWFDFLRHLHRAGLFTYEVFRSAAVVFRRTYQPEVLEQARPDDAFRAALWDHQQRFVAQWSEDLTEQNAAEFIKIRDFWGAKSLIKACEQIEKLGIRRVRFDALSEGIDRALLYMANLHRLEGETDALVGELRRFGRETLEAVFPIAGAGQHAVLRALGWEALQPLQRLVHEIAVQAYTDFDRNDVPNCDDPSCGVVDREHIRSAVKPLDAEAAERMLRLLVDAKVPGMNAATLVAAAAGFNRKQIEQGLKRRQQATMKAFGLLPLERGEDEVFERYALLKRMEREAKKRGPGQLTNERAAVQASLANLAQTAGYPDAARLEWAMEARLADRCASPDRMVDDYQLRLVTEGRRPTITVQRKGRMLKTVPAAVRQSEAYQELKELATSYDDQVQRFSQAFENMMVAEEVLDSGMLARLATLPVAAALLGRLVLCSAEGFFGLLDCQTMSLVDLHDEQTPISESLRIAHVRDLFENGRLASWQQAIVRRQIVQPFNQVFRELYVLTRAEEQAGTFSNRFLGHVLDSRKTAALLRARGWRGGGKLLSPHGLMGILRFSDVGHYLSETATVTSDCVYFVRRDTADPEVRSEWVPLSAVPPIAFSETMRDADLVVSVAHRGQDGLSSPEVYRSRAELIATLTAELGIEGIEIDGHFVYVQGRLARYRVHLASAAIHIEPGHYLCIVPDRSLPTESLYLPFANTCDPKAHEVLSKILLLLNDDRIDDPTIVTQIEAARTR